MSHYPQNPNSEPTMESSEEEYALYPYWIESSSDGDFLYYQHDDRYGSTFYKYSIEDNQLVKFKQINKRFFYNFINLFLGFIIIYSIKIFICDLSWKNFGFLVFLLVLFYFNFSSAVDAKNDMKSAWNKYKDKIKVINK